MNKIFVLCVCGVLLCGCAQISHLDQLLTLKSLAREQEGMKKYVQEQDSKFDKMLAEFRDGTLGQYSNQRKIRRAFGDPIYERNAVGDEAASQVWLYRYSTEFFGSEKIYLYFDQDGTAVRIEYDAGVDEQVE